MNGAAKKYGASFDKDFTNGSLAQLLILFAFYTHPVMLFGLGEGNVYAAPNLLFALNTQNSARTNINCGRYLSPTNALTPCFASAQSVFL